VETDKKKQLCNEADSIDIDSHELWDPHKFLLILTTSSSFVCWNLFSRTTGLGNIFSSREVLMKYQKKGFKNNQL